MVKEDTRIPNVLIVAKWVICRGIVNNGHSEIIIMHSLEIIEIGGLSLQVYVEDVERADTGRMNADLQGIDKAT